LRHEILIIGRGGQGILLMGRVIGLAAAKYAGLNVAATEVYGSETRGTESRADLIITDEDEIDYIKVRKPTVFVVMYPLNVEKYLGVVGEDTIVFLNSTYVSEIPGLTAKQVYRAPYTIVAEREAGTPRVANIVALGHIVARTRIVKPEYVERAIEESVPPQWLEVNLKAFRAGLNL